MARLSQRKLLLLEITDVLRSAPSVLLVSLLVSASIVPAQAARLGGAYFVDDAEIGKVGSCETETWSSFAANSDRITVFSPACVFNLGTPVELGTNLVSTRGGGDPGGSISATAKTVLLAPNQGTFGVAVSGAVVYDPIAYTASGAIFNIPITFDITKDLRLNVNAGVQYFANSQAWAPTGGLGVSWNFIKKWSVISEVFAIGGPAQTNPRWQSGIRYSPLKAVDFDLIYGRNIAGEQSNWITLAVTMRYGDD